MTRSFRPVSPGTGNAEVAAAAIAAALACILAGCSPDMKDGVGPRVPVPNVSGQIDRDGTAAASLDVSVRDPNTNTSIESEKTDIRGSYRFDVGPGVWEVRVKGSAVGDFESVTMKFAVSVPGEAVRIPPLDVFAFGSELTSPSNAATVDPPTPSNTLTFQWILPNREILSARVQVFDSTGAAVWYSPKSQDSTADWDGVGNEGVAAAMSAAAGTYAWRVKFELPDSSEARTQSWSLILR